MLKQQVIESMKIAMRAQDKIRLATIRLIQAAFKQKEIDTRVEIDDQLAIEILDKMIKQRRESIKQYELANRQDLVDKENNEMLVIQEFLPSPLTSEEIMLLVKQAIESTNAQSIRDMGKVMTILRPKLQGRADVAEVSDLIKEKFFKII